MNKIFSVNLCIDCFGRSDRLLIGCKPTRALKTIVAESVISYFKVALRQRMDDNSHGIILPMYDVSNVGNVCT